MAYLQYVIVVFPDHTRLLSVFELINFCKTSANMYIPNNAKLLRLANILHTSVYTILKCISLQHFIKMYHAVREL